MNSIANKIFIFTTLFVMAFSFGCATNSESSEEFVTVSGTATYRQRIAMPPDAELSVQVEDISLADTQSPVLAELSERFGDRQVPLAFTLHVPNTAIHTNHRYNLRARITVGGGLRFTTTRNYPVLTHGEANDVDLVLDAVAVNTAGRLASALPSAFSLPATFSGILPCADCPGITHTLTLRSDGLYHLRRIYQDKPDGSFTEAGGWKVTDNVLSLNDGAETSLFAIIDDGTLRRLDQLGQTIQSSANLDLRRTAEIDPLNESLQWRGEFQYLADAATFTDCASGLRWPVAMTGDYLTVERNYTKSSVVPGSPLWVTFKGRLEQDSGMEGSAVEQMVIERFSTSQPDKSCASGTAELKDTYWKLVDLGDQQIPIAPSPSNQIHMTLASEGSRVSGFSGCNRLIGSFEQTGNELRFLQMAGTMRACLSPEIMKLENQVLNVLNTTTHYRIEGEHLLLLAGDEVIARFESLYLR